MEYVIYKNKQFKVTNYRLELYGLSITDINQISNLDNLKTVRYLYLQDNDLISIKGLEKLTSLKTLDLYKNKISEIDGLDTLENLEILNISNNEIKSINGLNGLHKLKKLDISTNKIESIRGLENLTNLEELRLSDNKINKVSGLDLLINLKDLYLNLNEIEIIENINHLSALTFIDLSLNPISKITGFENLNNLKNIRLNDTLITKELFDKLGGRKNDFDFRVKMPQNLVKYCQGDFVEYDGIFHYVKNKHLKLNNFGIEDITDISHLNELSKLEILQLRGNRIKRIHGLGTLLNLKNLYLSNNKIEKIANLESLKKLELLAINDNKITEISGLEKLQNLKHFNLSNNDISEIKGLYNILNLRELGLSGNNITEIRNIQMLKNLEELHLADNEISLIQGLDNLTNLKKLYLQFNKVELINGINNLQDLEILNLSNNSIRKIENLSFCSKLKELNLSDNNISMIERLENLQQLTSINLGNNKIEPDVYKFLKFTDNNPRLFVSYCFLKPIIENITDKLLWSDIIKGNPYLSKVNYDELRNISNKFRCVEVQINKNYEIQTILTPKCLNIKLDDLLDPFPEDEELSYNFITDKLRLINQESTKKFCKYIIEKRISNFALYESENGIRKIKKTHLTHQLALFDTLNQRYFLRLKLALFRSRLSEIEKLILSKKEKYGQTYKFAFINDEIMESNKAAIKYLEKNCGWHLEYYPEDEKKTDIDMKLIRFANDINNLYSRDWDKIYLITVDQGLINSILDTYKASPHTEIFIISPPNGDLLQSKPNLKKINDHDFELNIHYRV